MFSPNYNNSFLKETDPCWKPSYDPTGSRFEYPRVSIYPIFVMPSFWNAINISGLLSIKLMEEVNYY